LFRPRAWKSTKSIHSARHFTKMVDLLRDIARDGFTKANAERAHILLTTIGNRTPRLVKDKAA
jgi:hypothetical protein